MAALNKVIAFAATKNPDQAKLFYRDKLGFKFLSDDGFALVFDLQGTMLRIAKMKDFTPAPYTILGREVAASELFRALPGHAPGQTGDLGRARRSQGRLV
jgi:catechol 2,3-dioxygenase-like lactoylglutathione lyase family enzyme